MIREMYKKIKGYDDKLKPCPFCGSPAELWEYSPAVNSFQKVVMCGNDDAKNDHEGECPMYMSPEGFYRATKKEAIETWNARR